MPGSPDSSFIPKHGPVARKRKTAPKQVYVLTLVSYVCMFAALLSAGGVFLYSNLIKTQLNTEVAGLDQDIKGFSEADMQRVIDLDLRLAQANARLQNSASVLTILEAMEESVIQSVQLQSLSVERTDAVFSVTAELGTDTFDSVIFQRKIFNLSQLLAPITVSDTALTVETSDSEGGTGSTAQTVTFTAEFAVSTAAVPYQVGELNLPAVTPLELGSEQTDEDLGLDDEAEADSAIESLAGDEETVEGNTVQPDDENALPAVEEDTNNESL